MNLDVTFLGTAASVPTAHRAPSATLLRRGGDQILVDCAEGTQRQLMRSLGLGDLDAVLVTHAHGDHYLGLPGMLKTFELRDREAPLLLVGPPGFRKLLAALRIVFGRVSFDLQVVEAEPGWCWKQDGYVVEAFETSHTVPSVGYRLVEQHRPGRFDVEEARRLGVPDGPLFGALQRGETVELANGTIVTADMVVGEGRRGRSVVLTGDTRATSDVRNAATRADLLVHEATFAVQDAERAIQTGHSTARDAALLAVAAEVEMLAITHLSTRYLGRELLDEAREVFPETICPRDFDQIDIPFPERGRPRHLKNGARLREGTPEPAGESSEPAGLALQ